MSTTNPWPRASSAVASRIERGRLAVAAWLHNVLEGRVVCRCFQGGSSASVLASGSGSLEPIFFRRRVRTQRRPSSIPNFIRR
ncbi:hypothetical protein AKJ09_08020 [Labilithrix luteola]|uniref:Uncharacterized protein n=1 Tax=Labilithrix luteola TaxID=1391654 RepID=A0A0K1Q6T3_9BACT|nr:hypothetical protein AKJ09_08020 [Labilithrix luteola]